MINSYHEKIANILRVDKRHLFQLEQDLEKITGKAGVIQRIAEENERLVSEKLDQLSLNRHARALDIYNALISKVESDDLRLFEYIKIDSLKNPNSAQKIADFVKVLHPPGQGTFLKIEKARQFLIAEPPKKILEALGYKYVEEILEKEDILEVYSALRFLEDRDWLNDVFFKQYESLRTEDFEERPIVLRALNPKWGVAAERFVAKKYHNVSHLKELGVIFVIPIFLNISGETLRLVSLLTHYLNEVKFYSELFEEYKKSDGTFAEKIISLLRGDVVEERLPEHLPEVRRARFLLVQRYLAKDDPNDWRLFEPRINPEALHWQRAEEDMVRIMEVYPDFHNGLDFWKGLGWVGDYFKTDVGVDVLTSFNLIDTTMALVMQKELVKYLYHHQEALWNKIFVGYFGEEELLRRCKAHILEGYFEV